MREERAQQLGHNLLVASRAGVPISYCSRCAAHGTWRWSKLLDACPRTPPTAQGQRWLHITKTTGEAPMQLSRGQKARLGTTTRKKARNPLKNKIVKACTEHHDPLRNKAYADSTDKSNWRPTLRPPKIVKPTKAAKANETQLDDAMDGTPDEHHTEINAAQVDAPDEDRFMAAEIFEELQCEECQATILDTDRECAACGSARSSASFAAPPFAAAQQDARPRCDQAFDRQEAEDERSSIFKFTEYPGPERQRQQPGRHPAGTTADRYLPTPGETAAAHMRPCQPAGHCQHGCAYGPWRCLRSPGRCTSPTC